MSAQLSLRLTYAFLAFVFFSNLGVTAELTIPANGSFSVPASATMQMGCADLNAGGATVLNAGQIQQAGNVSIPASGSFNAGSGSLQVGGNWTNNGTFVAGTSTVSFVSGCSAGNPTLSGTTTFNNLSLTSTAARTFIIESGHYTTVNGTLNLTGSPGPVTLAPSAGSTAYVALGPNAIYNSTNASVPSTVQIGNNGGGGGGGGGSTLAPGIPTNPQATPGNANATVRWSIPSSGGSVTSYTVTSSPSGLTCSATAPTTTCAIEGLTNGTAYTFSVVANNAYGSSSASVPSNSVIPSTNIALPPTEPLNVAATGGNGEVTINWSSPISGGQATTYRVTSLPGGLTCNTVAPVTSCNIKGLTNGISYTFEVIASNSYGDSPASSPSNAVVPSGEPVDGFCGTGEGIPTLVAPPKEQLCKTGVPSLVTANAGYFNWSCSGIGAGIQANCVAPGALTDTGSSKVTLEVPNCTITASSLSTISGQPPAGITFPYGAVKFTANQCSVTTVKPRVTYSSAVDEMNFWEFISNTWVEGYKTGLSGYTVQLQLQDNDQFDANPAIGVIGNNAGPATSNNKLAQRLLFLSVKKQTIASGKKLKLRLRGGKGRGKLKFTAEATGGAQCNVKGRTLRTRGSYTGTCIVRAIKLGDKKYNATSSNPVIVNVVGAAPPAP